MAAIINIAPWLDHKKGITTVLTLSTLALDSRTDLPKVHYATALDWFIFTTFGYCMASLIQFAAVHYFTKVTTTATTITTTKTLPRCYQVIATAMMLRCADYEAISVLS